MPTKNIQDVVAEKVEELYKKWDSYDEPENDQYGFMAQDGRVRVEFVADWLTTTLTQLVKEVEAGERERIKSMAQTLFPVIQGRGRDDIEYGAKLFREMIIREALTPPTSVEALQDKK